MKTYYIKSPEISDEQDRPTEDNALAKDWQITVKKVGNRENRQ